MWKLFEPRSIAAQLSVCVDVDVAFVLTIVLVPVCLLFHVFVCVLVHVLIHTLIHVSWVAHVGGGQAGADHAVLPRKILAAMDIDIPCSSQEPGDRFTLIVAVLEQQ